MTPIDDTGEVAYTAVSRPPRPTEATSAAAPRSAPPADTTPQAIPQVMDMGDDALQQEGTEQESLPAPVQDGVEYVLDDTYSTPLEAIDPKKEHIPLPSVTVTDLMESSAILGDSWRNGTKTSDDVWARVTKGSVRSMPSADGYVAPLADGTREWKKGIDTAQGLLRSSAPNVRLRQGVKLIGHQAVAFATQALKIGQVYSVMLVHSGFWVRLRAPSESSILELHRQLQAEKVSLGRATWGLLFSNTSSYFTQRLLDFTLEHVLDTSVNNPNEADLRDLISVHDLPILFWGLARAHWPNGFQFSRSCIRDASKCKHVSHGMLNLGELFRIDNKALTASQRKHMASVGKNTMSMESLQRYREEFLRGSTSNVTLKAGDGTVNMTLRSPTAAQHIRAGQDWVQSIEDAYPAALEMSEDERDAYLWSQGRASTMRQYTHYVQSITVADQVLDDPETVAMLLDNLSKDEAVRLAFMKAVAKFIDDSVVAMVALQTYRCPSCNELQTAGREKGRFPDYIPLDAGAIFFSLVAQRVAVIEAR
jgi:hypothetical protein